MTRRRLLALLAFGLAALAAAGGWLWRRLWAPAAPAPTAGEAGIAVPARDLAVLLSVADVIVPRAGAQPAASETPLLDRFALRFRESPELARLYERGLPAFADAVRSRVPRVAGALDAERLMRLCEHLYRELREAPDPSPAARFFEVLRHDVLLAYYATPAGWASVGYRGPVSWTAERLAGAPTP